MTNKFLKYGASVVEFFRLQKRLLFLFLILSLIAAVQMLLYAHRGGLEYMNTKVPTYVQTSFGNMGFAKPVCSKDVVDFEEKLALINLNF